MFRCANRIPSDPTAHHYLLIQHCESATAELLWALSQKSCQRRGWHIQCQRSHWPAQLSSAVPSQFSPVCAWSLHWGAVSQPWSFSDRGVGMQECAPSIEPAQTNGESELDKDPSVRSQALLEQRRNRGAWLHLAWHIHAGWMTTGFPKVSHLPESITLFQSPNSNSLSNPPISHTYSDMGRTLGFHSLETPESFLSSSMNSQVYAKNVLTVFTCEPSAAVSAQLLSSTWLWTAAPEPHSHSA